MRRSSFITWDQLKVGVLIIVALFILAVAHRGLVIEPHRRHGAGGEGQGAHRAEGLHGGSKS